MQPEIKQVPHKSEWSLNFISTSHVMGEGGKHATITDPSPP